MKTQRDALDIVILTAISASIFLNGCVATTSGNTKALLSDAGFHVRTPQTPQQKEIYAALPAYKVERAIIRGKTIYVFKDEKAGVAYIGREEEYQKYAQICIERRIAHGYYDAVRMDPTYAHRWYAAWGTRGMWSD